MTEENISQIKVCKRFKKHYLVPTNHNIIRDTIAIYGIAIDKKLVKIHYKVLVGDDNHIDAIVPQEKYISYFISYIIEGNFKRIIIKPDDYVHCKKMGGEYSFVFDNIER